MPDIPAHSMIRPDDHIPQRVERSTVFLPRTHGIHLWNLREAMMLQMDRLKGVEVDKIERAEYMPHPDVGLDPSKDIVMSKFMNDTIKIEMQNAQGHKKPGSKARIPPYQRQSYGYGIEPNRAQHNSEFLTILDPGIHRLQSSQVCCRNTRYASWDTRLSRGSTRQEYRGDRRSPALCRSTKGEIPRIPRHTS